MSETEPNPLAVRLRNFASSARLHRLGTVDQLVADLQEAADCVEAAFDGRTLKVPPMARVVPWDYPDAEIRTLGAVLSVIEAGVQDGMTATGAYRLRQYLDGKLDSIHSRLYEQETAAK